METPQEPTSGSTGATPPEPPAVAPAPPPMTPPPVAAAPPPASQWEAPEYVAGPAPGYAFGGFGERLVAYIIDILITGAVIVVIAILGGLVIAGGAATDNGLLAGTGLVVLVLALVIIPLAYFPYFWARDGQTPGMRALGLKVVRDADGGPISGGQAILRLIGYWVSGAVFYLGYIWIFIDKRRRGWHDLIAGTVVVKRQ
jgi:uncharacterized RDD family membrane protein YckC